VEQTRLQKLLASQAPNNPEATPPPSPTGAPPEVPDSSSSSGELSGERAGRCEEVYQLVAGLEGEDGVMSKEELVRAYGGDYSFFEELDSDRDKAVTVYYRVKKRCYLLFNTMVCIMHYTWRSP